MDELRKIAKSPAEESLRRRREYWARWLNKPPIVVERTLIIRERRVYILA